MKFNFNLVKVLVLLLIVILIVFLLNDFFVTKAHEFRGSLAFEGYYNLKKDTIDILLFGNSHSYIGINSVQIESELGVDVFQVQSISGNIEHMVFQLEECLKTQNPKIVILEMFCLYEFQLEDDERKLDSIILKQHAAFDTMKLSKSKINGINYNIPKSEQLEYYIPIIPYHLRWKDKNINRALSNSLNPEYKSNQYNGFEMYDGIYSTVIGDPIPDIHYNNQPINIAQSKKESLKKFVELCEDNDIKLIFVALPYIEQVKFSNQDLIDSIKAVESDLNLTDNAYIDFNLYKDDINLDKTDLHDAGHLNIGGATKVANYLAEYIKLNTSDLLTDCVLDYPIESNKRFNRVYDKYVKFIDTKNAILNNTELNTYSYCGNFKEYFSSLVRNDYTIIIASKNFKPQYLDSNTSSYAKELGLEFNIDNDEQCNYVAVVDRDNVLEYKTVANKNINIKKGFSDLQSLNLSFDLEVFSSNVNSGSRSSIIIDGKEYSINQDGFNMVVYDKALKKVVSQANFNLNENRQHYFDRELAPSNYDKNKILYTFDTKTKIKNLIGASGSEVVEDGILIHSNSRDPKFNLSDYESNSNHILLKSEIVCPNATWFEVRFDGLMEREQLVTGENTVYIEMNLDEPIKSIRIDPANGKGYFLIKSIEICDLSK